MRNTAFISFLFILYSDALFSQKIIADTAFIPFGIDTVPSFIDASLSNIDDVRGEINTISIGEKKKYVFLQTDHFTCTRLPLHDEIAKSFNWDTTLIFPAYSFQIIDFKTEPMTGWNSKGVILFSKISILYHPLPDKTDTLGVLLHETMYKKSGKLKKIDINQPAISNWKKEFSKDITTISDQIGNGSSVSLYNLRPPEFANKNYMIPSVGAFIGFNNFILDGAILYSHPEAAKKFYRHSYLLRYRNSTKFEALEFPIMNEEKNIRRNNNWLFELGTASYMGIIRWKDIDEVDHAMYEILLLDFSASQMFVFNKLGRGSIIAGIGLMETASFVAPKRLQIDAGLKIKLGYKL